MMLDAENLAMDEPKEQDNADRIAAFEAIVSEYEGALLRYVSRILCDPDHAQDVVQDTFIKLFQQWKEEFVLAPNLLSWLYRVAHNAAVDQLRKRARRRLLFQERMEEEEQEQNVAESRAHESDPGEATEKAQMALGVLSNREQQLVILKVYEEKSYKEISVLTGLTVTNVGYILHHAMKKMAEALREAGMK